MPSFSCTVAYDIQAGLRLDRYAAEYLKILSRSQVKARNLEAFLNGKKVKISKPLYGGEVLELSWAEPEISYLIPQNIPLDVVYENKRVIVINKPQGMVVHPGAGNRQGTLANALLYRHLSNSSIADGALTAAGERPGIVHRLDKDTSGVIIAAWDYEAHAFLSEQFKARRVRKTYAAIVRGCPRESSGFIDKKIIRSKKDRKTFTISETEGRPSLTHYRVVKSWGNYSLLILRPKTGRTHQIRVHLKYLGCPILGDPVYGFEDRRFPDAGLMLHAKRLSVILPGCKKNRTFKTVFPERFRNIIRILNVMYK